MAALPPIPASRRRWREPGTVLLAVGFVMALVALAAFVAPRLVTALAPRHPVQVVVDGQLQADLATRAHTVGQALQEAGVVLHPGDRVSPDLDQPLVTKAPTEIQIRRALFLRVEADGLSRSGYSAASGISEALAEFGVTLGAQDRVQVQSEGADALTIRVVRVQQEMALESVELPFETVKRAVDYLPEGTVEEVQAGTPGLVERTLRHTYEDGELVETEVVAESQVREPTPRILAYGTAGTVSRGGEVYRYREALEMRATAYSPGDGFTPGQYTATGILAQRGVAAVDPSVIPLGTRLYVEGYGPALAADTGGAIKGHRIDLAFDTPEEARQFGVKYVKVYILDTP